MAFEQAAASDADQKIKEQASYNYALCIHETSYSAFGESVTVFEHFLNEFPNSVYADKVSNYLVEVYMNTRSYDAALKSIERIARPGKAILEAKQKVLFQLGTQSFANTQFEQAINYFNQSIALGQYNLQTKADALYWRGESYYRLNRMQEAARNFNEYLSLAPQKNTEMYALAYYNLAYIAFHKKDYATAQDRFLKFIQLQKNGNATVLADAYNRIGDCYMHVRKTWVRLPVITPTTNWLWCRACKRTMTEKLRYSTNWPASTRIHPMPSMRFMRKAVRTCKAVTVTKPSLLSGSC